MSAEKIEASQVDGRAMESCNPVKLLMLDDSATDREILRRLLVTDPQNDYSIAAFASIDEALNACRSDAPDCVLLDYALGDGTGLDFLQALRLSPDTRDIAVVMLTGSGNEEVAADAFRTGAQDYLPKGGLSADALQRAISSAIYKAQTERLLEAQRRELQRLFIEAQQANARKDQFLATLSHELRTPLTPVLTAVTAVRPREMSPEELDELFATIRRNILLEARLIDDLLDLTRITRGKLLLDLQPCDLHAVLRHAIETCREEIAAKNLDLTVDLRAYAHTVVGDAARLQQVLWNLLKNAVKFTPERGAIVVATQVLLPHRHIEIRIQDTGIGIPQSSMPNIFRAFEQGLEEIPRRFGGLGLGLAIAGAIVEAHHGEIRAESDGKDRGATFFVHIPLAQSESEGLDAPPNSPAPVGNLTAPATGRILLVEDHSDSARVMAGLLKRRGLQVVVAHSIADAVEVYTRESFDALLSDIGLPDGSGVELLNLLTAIRPIPAIALSGYGTEADVARSREAGFLDHLVKPVEWPKLNAALTQILSEKLAR